LGSKIDMQEWKYRYRPAGTENAGVNIIFETLGKYVGFVKN